MKFDDLIREAENPKYIEGIYNYCDKWCEKCNFTSQCLNYTMSSKSLIQDNTISTDFIEGLNEILEDTLAFITEKAVQEGFDLSKIEIDIKTAEDLNDEIDNKISVQKSLEYSKECEKWIESYLPEANDSEYLTEILEGLKWYHTQIYVKLKRAYMGFNVDANKVELKRDADGSAKVALICIDKSITLWERLNEFGIDNLFNFNKKLKEISSLIEIDFPDARWFIRPGFDLQN